MLSDFKLPHSNVLRESKLKNSFAILFNINLYYRRLL